MDNDKLFRLFQKLQDPPFQCINRKRKIRSIPKFSIDCCTFTANRRSGFIEYDPFLLEFLNEEQIVWILLHEEGHMRFQFERIDWNDNPVNNNDINTPDDSHRSEYNADMYAARKMLENFPDLKAYEIMERAVMANCYCNPKSFFCFLKKWLKKVCNALKFLSFESTHPPMSVRIKKTKEFYEENVLKNQ
ncbi:MAG: hypothetical protein ABSG49_10140 [Methanoregula sp.]|jgi:hypothetical protein|uniref:hypothetical protein n=1 Tax=Methanoregula sp. TaxID=2052170 RepID=UPI003C146B1B